MSDVDDCFQKGLLKEAIPNLSLAKKSIKQALFFLGETEKLIDADMKEMAVIALYDSLFHASRALLYKDGIKERSHYCIARFLEERYVKENLLQEKFLSVFEKVMSIRHNVQYSTEDIRIDEDLSELHNHADDYIKEVEKLL